MPGSTPDGNGAILRGPVKDHPAPSGVAGLVREISTATPEAVALVDGLGSVTYAELETASDEVALRLAEAGGQPGDVVAVCIPRGRHLVFALLGALKAGMPYLPLAPDDPLERRLDILRRSGTGFVMVTQESADDLGPAEGAGPRVVRVDASASSGPPGAVSPPVRWLPLPSVADDHPAYVLYTSGSTGEPKGVVVPSLALCNRLVWMRDAYGFSPHDRILQKTPATFDVSGWELLGPLVSGATEVLMAAGAHRDPGEVMDSVLRHAVTICHFVPSMLEEFLRWPGAKRCMSLRAVFCSGEALTPGLVRRFRSVLPDADLHNLYGPTEAAIDVTSWECPRQPAELDRVLIGGPIDNCTLVVLDEDMRPVTDGGAGQLAIGGVPLAHGYLNRPDLTEASFVPAPDWCPVPRLYLTGDLVRRHGDSLEYLGRMDHQVKIRGQRVELRETEDILRDLDVVRDAAVVAAAGPDGVLVVCAFVVPDAGTTADDEFWRSLRKRVAAALPEPFVPALFSAAASIPLTSSGKQDQKALKALARERMAERAPSGPVPGAPADELLACWIAAVAAAPGDESTGFLDAGGHSLAAARLAGRILSRWGVRIPLSAFLRDNTSLARLRSLVPETAPSRRPATVVRPVDGVRPISPEQRRLWLWQQIFPQCPAYNVVGVLRVEGRVDSAALHQACGDLIARHESLRTVVEQDSSGELRQRVMPPSVLERFTERTVGDAETDRVREFIAEITDVPFAPDRLPRLAVGLLHGGAQPGGKTSRVVLSLDHLVSDQHSLDLLQRELSGLYAARLNGTVAELPEPVQFGDAVAVAPDEEDGFAARHTADLAFWRERLAGVRQRLDLPHRAPRRGLPDHRGADVVVDLGRRSSLELDRVCREEHITIATLAMSAYARALTAWTGGDSVLVGVPMSGRETDEQHEAVGFFMRTVPVRLDVPSGANTRDVLRPVADAVVEAAEHMTPTFEEIVAHVAADRAPDVHPLFQVWFNDLTQADAPTVFGDAPARPSEPMTRWSLFDLGLYLSRLPDGGYRLRLAYATDFWDSGAAADFLEACREAVLSLLAPGVAPGERHALEPAAARSTCGDLVRSVLRRAEPDPARPALIGSDDVDTVTYGGLAGWIRRVSHLVREGTEPGQPVAVLARRDAGLAAAILGTWHAGRPVLLVDATAPAAWQEKVLSAADTALVLVTGSDTASGFTCVPVDGTDLSDPGPDMPQVEFAPGAVGHLLATSGTSGRPAVVMLPADALPESLEWYGSELGLGEDEVFCLTTPAAHDPVLRSLLLPLTLGARVHIPGPGRIERPEEHLQLLAESGATVLHLTPSQAGILTTVRGERVLPAVRSVVFHGEPLHDAQAEAVSALTPRATLFNLYGTTETPQASSLHRWSPTPGSRASASGRGSVPIGRGAPYRSLEVVSGANRPALVGEAGELVVTGRGLALGYLGDPGRTGSTVVSGGVRRYPTGDLARRDRHGEVTLTGRTDRQVSVGGYRIELDEVEGLVARLRGVSRCAVATDPENPDALIAWVAGSRLGSDGELSVELARFAPRWQQPARWIRLSDLPVTPNGKADVAALLRQVTRERGGRRPATPAAQPPPMPSEALTELIVDRARALCPDNGHLMPDTVFFDAGMVSMTLFQLFNTLTTADGLNISLADVFRFPTPRTLAAHLSAGSPATSITAPARRPESAESVTDERNARRTVRQALRRRIQDPSSIRAAPYTMKGTPKQ
ncbi:amino acid adenylation domain-containing protein [Streptomyces goshikiensis]|uniref:amino acid adenylation domain-containing protein n=1 Tax=Streptomyces goshikiensis TaxID=1942 RepID=UPI0038184217